MSRLDMLDMLSRFSFDPSNIQQGPTISLKRCEYTAFASNVASVEQAIEMLEYIGFCTHSEDCLPFAVSLVNAATGEHVNVFEDNGEFGAGALLNSCLRKLDGFNAMVCVSRRVRDAFVHEMVQPQKARVIKEAATGAIDQLLPKLTNAEESSSVLFPVDGFNDCDDTPVTSPKAVRRTLSTSSNRINVGNAQIMFIGEQTTTKTRPTLPTVRISLDQSTDIESALPLPVIPNNNQHASKFPKQNHSSIHSNNNNENPSSIGNNSKKYASNSSKR